jgi:NAD(P)H-flavin reductase
MIPLGDIDLQHEIRLDQESVIVGRRSGRGSVRRMYSAKIDGRKSRMTVAVYRGNSAEDVCLAPLLLNFLRHSFL